jgi:sugar phosphate isomerase/epimerase
MTTHELAVQAWSLDRTLGRARTGGATPAGALDLLDLPAALRAHGYSAVQLCHFQFTATDAAYLRDLRAALEAHGVRLDALLIDDGDLTGPDSARDEAWVMEWIDHAETLGADRARVIAGKTRTEDAVGRSSAALGRIAARAGGIRVVTENWFDVTATAADVRGILDPLEGRVGLLVDLANWTGPGKHEELRRVAPFAETCHAKAHWSGSRMDESDYRASLATIVDAGYAGPLALVYDADSDDEWAGLSAQRAVVEDLLAASRVAAG